MDREIFCWFIINILLIEICDRARKNPWFSAVGLPLFSYPLCVQDVWVSADLKIWASGVYERKRSSTGWCGGRSAKVSMAYIYLFIFFFFNLSCHVASNIFKIKNKPLITSVFFIQYLTARTILIQGWKVEDQFNTVEKLRTNLTQKLKVEDQNNI